MKRYVVNLENSEPLTFDADWVRNENGLIIMYVGLKQIAYFSPQKLVSIEIVGDIQPEQLETPMIPSPPTQTELETEDEETE